MPIDLEQQLRSYGDALDRFDDESPRVEHRRSRRPARAVVLLAAVLVAVLGVAAIVVLRDSNDGDGKVAVEPTPSDALPAVLTRIPWYAPQPLAVGGGDVWLARKVLGDDGTFVQVERHDPATAALKAPISVPQETVFGIAADDTQVYVAGGGDGGVPDTTVSAIDMRTNKVVWTRTLTTATCSCPIVAGAAGVWLGGNGSDHVLRLDPADGNVIANIRLPAPSTAFAIAAVGLHVEIGLQDGSVAFVSPTANVVMGSVREPGGASSRRPTAIVPVSKGRVGLALFDDGTVAQVEAEQLLPTDRRYKMAPKGGVDGVHTDTWAVGGDRLGITGRRAATFVYDRTAHKFDPTTDALLFQPAQQGFTQIVRVDDRLWIFDVGEATAPAPAVLVVRIPAE